MSEGYEFAREGFNVVKNSGAVGIDRDLSPEMLAELNVTGRPPESQRHNAVATAAPDVPLPFVSVARQIVGRHITGLHATLAHIDRELAASSPLTMTGQPNPYQLDRINGLREQAERVKAEIDHLNSLSDHEAQIFALEHGR